MSPSNYDPMYGWADDDAVGSDGYREILEEKYGDRLFSEEFFDRQNRAWKRAQAGWNFFSKGLSRDEADQRLSPFSRSRSDVYDWRDDPRVRAEAAEREKNYLDFHNYLRNQNFGEGVSIGDIEHRDIGAGDPQRAFGITTSRGDKKDTYYFYQDDSTGFMGFVGQNNRGGINALPNRVKVDESGNVAGIQTAYRSIFDPETGTGIIPEAMKRDERGREIGFWNAMSQFQGHTQNVRWESLTMPERVRLSAGTPADLENRRDRGWFTSLFAGGERSPSDDERMDGMTRSKITSRAEQLGSMMDVYSRSGNKSVYALDETLGAIGFAGSMRDGVMHRAVQKFKRMLQTTTSGTTVGSAVGIGLIKPTVQAPAYFWSDKFSGERGPGEGFLQENLIVFDQVGFAEGQGYGKEQYAVNRSFDRIIDKPKGFDFAPGMVFGQSNRVRPPSLRRDDLQFQDRSIKEIGEYLGATPSGDFFEVTGVDDAGDGKIRVRANTYEGTFSQKDRSKNFVMTVKDAVMDRFSYYDESRNAEVRPEVAFVAGSEKEIGNKAVRMLWGRMGDRKEFEQWFAGRIQNLAENDPENVNFQKFVQGTGISDFSDTKQIVRAFRSGNFGAGRRGTINEHAQDLLTQEAFESEIAERAFIGERQMSPVSRLHAEYHMRGYLEKEIGVDAVQGLLKTPAPEGIRQEDWEFQQIYENYMSKANTFKSDRPAQLRGADGERAMLPGGEEREYERFSQVAFKRMDASGRLVDADMHSATMVDFGTIRGAMAGGLTLENNRAEYERSTSLRSAESMKFAEMFNPRVFDAVSRIQEAGGLSSHGSRMAAAFFANSEGALSPEAVDFDPERFRELRQQVAEMRGLESVQADRMAARLYGKETGNAMLRMRIGDRDYIMPGAETLASSAMMVGGDRNLPLPGNYGIKALSSFTQYAASGSEEFLETARRELLDMYGGIQELMDSEGGAKRMLGAELPQIGGIARGGTDIPIGYGMVSLSAITSATGMDRDTAIREYGWAKNEETGQWEHDPARANAMLLMTRDPESDPSRSHTPVYAMFSELLRENGSELPDNYPDPGSRIIVNSEQPGIQQQDFDADRSVAVSNYAMINGELVGANVATPEEMAELPYKIRQQIMESRYNEGQKQIEKSRDFGNFPGYIQRAREALHGGGAFKPVNQDTATQTSLKTDIDVLEGRGKGWVGQAYQAFHRGIGPLAHFAAKAAGVSAEMISRLGGNIGQILHSSYQGALDLENVDPHAVRLARLASQDVVFSPADTQGNIVKVAAREDGGTGNIITKPYRDKDGTMKQGWVYGDQYSSIDSFAQNIIETVAKVGSDMSDPEEYRKQVGRHYAMGMLPADVIKQAEEEGGAAAVEALQNRMIDEVFMPIREKGSASGDVRAAFADITQRKHYGDWLQGKGADGQIDAGNLSPLGGAMVSRWSLRDKATGVPATNEMRGLASVQKRLWKSLSHPSAEGGMAETIGAFQESVQFFGAENAQVEAAALHRLGAEGLDFINSNPVDATMAGLVESLGVPPAPASSPDMTQISQRTSQPPARSADGQPDRSQQLSAEEVARQKKRRMAIMGAQTLRDQKDFVVLDTETTDFADKGGMPVQISIIDKEGNTLFDSLINPGNVEWSQGAMDTHGITPEMVETAPTYAEIQDQIREILAPEGVSRNVVAYNSKFDERALENAERSVGGTYAPGTWRDAGRAYRDFAGIADGKSGWKLSDAAEALGVEWQGEAHDALADVRATLGVVNAIASHDLPEPVQVSLSGTAAGISSGAATTMPSEADPEAVRRNVERWSGGADGGGGQPPNTPHAPQPPPDEGGNVPGGNHSAAAQNIRIGKVIQAPTPPPSELGAKEAFEGLRAARQLSQAMPNIYGAGAQEFVGALGMNPQQALKSFYQMDRLGKTARRLNKMRDPNYQDLTQADLGFTDQEFLSQFAPGADPENFDMMVDTALANYNEMRGQFSGDRMFALMEAAQGGGETYNRFNMGVRQERSLEKSAERWARRGGLSGRDASGRAVTQNDGDITAFVGDFKDSLGELAKSLKGVTETTKENIQTLKQWTKDWESANEQAEKLQRATGKSDSELQSMAGRKLTDEEISEQLGLKPGKDSQAAIATFRNLYDREYRDSRTGEVVARGQLEYLGGRDGRTARGLGDAANRLEDGELGVQSTIAEKSFRGAVGTYYTLSAGRQIMDMTFGEMQRDVMAVSGWQDLARTAMGGGRGSARDLMIAQQRSDMFSGMAAEEMLGGAMSLLRPDSMAGARFMQGMRVSGGIAGGSLMASSALGQSGFGGIAKGLGMAGMVGAVASAGLSAATYAANELPGTSLGGFLGISNPNLAYVSSGDLAMMGGQQIFKGVDTLTGGLFGAAIGQDRFDASINRNIPQESRERFLANNAAAIFMQDMAASRNVTQEEYGAGIMAFRGAYGGTTSSTDFFFQSVFPSNAFTDAEKQQHLQQIGLPADADGVPKEMILADMAAKNAGQYGLDPGTVAQQALQFGSMNYPSSTTGGENRWGLMSRFMSANPYEQAKLLQKSQMTSGIRSTVAAYRGDENAYNWVDTFFDIQNADGFVDPRMVRRNTIMAGASVAAGPYGGSLIGDELAGDLFEGMTDSQITRWGSLHAFGTRRGRENIQGFADAISGMTDLQGGRYESLLQNMEAMGFAPSSENDEWASWLSSMLSGGKLGSAQGLLGAAASAGLTDDADVDRISSGIITTLANAPGTMGIDAATGYFQAFQGMGIDASQALDMGMQYGAQFYNPQQQSRLIGGANQFIGMGISSGRAITGGAGMAGMSNMDFMRTNRFLGGDPYTYSAVANTAFGQQYGLKPLVDTNTGLGIFQEEQWGLQAQSAALSYQNQMFSIGQQRQQLAISNAFQFGGTFQNPLTGKMQVIGNGGQMGIQRQQFEMGIEQQQWGFDFGWRQHRLSDEKQQWQFDFEQRQFNWNDQRQQKDFSIQEEKMNTQYQWQIQDWTYGENVSQLQYGWQQEDLNRNIRYARGRERLDLERQKRRSVISESMRREHSDDQRDRIDKQHEWAKEALELQKEYYEKNKEFQKERMEKEREFYARSKEMQEEKMNKEKEFFDRNLPLQQQLRDMQEEQAKIQAEMQKRAIDHSASMAAQQHAIQMREMEISQEVQRRQAEMQMFLSVILPQLIESGKISFEELFAAITSGSQKAIGSIMAKAGAYSAPTGPVGGNPGGSGNAVGDGSGVISIFADGGYVDPASVIDPSVVMGFSGGGRVPMRSFREGGYTGRAGKYQPRGVVHGGEYVIPQEGAPVVRGDNTQTVKLLEAILKELRVIAGYGPAKNTLIDKRRVDPHLNGLYTS